jgi:RNA polymerase sigma factor (TIGR02999 family)
MWFMSEITRLLDLVREGDQQAAAELLPVVYQELRCLARRHMAAERAGHTLQATALVHEAYLRLVGDQARDGASSGPGATAWDCRGHFFAAAAEAMRRILIEHARAKNTAKRGGQHRRVEFSDQCASINSPSSDFEDVLAIDEALERLAKEAPAKAQLVKLRYFAGLSLEEASQAMGISLATAKRHWAFARAWLFNALERGTNRRQN